MPGANKRLIQDKQISFDSLPEFLTLYRETRRSAQPVQSNPNDSSGPQETRNPSGPDWSLSSELNRFVEKIFDFVWSEAIVLTRYHLEDFRSNCTEPSFGQAWYYNPKTGKIAPPSVISRRALCIVKFCPNLVPDLERVHVTRKLIVHHANQVIQEFGALDTAESLYQVLQALNQRGEWSEGDQAKARVVARVCRRHALLRILYDWVPTIGDLRQAVVDQVIKRYQSIYEVRSSVVLLPLEPAQETRRSAQALYSLHYNPATEGPPNWELPIDTKYDNYSEYVDDVLTLRGDPFRRSRFKPEYHVHLRDDLSGWAYWQKDNEGNLLRFDHYYTSSYDYCVKSPQH